MTSTLLTMGLAVAAIGTLIANPVAATEGGTKACEIHVTGAGWPKRIPTMPVFVELKRQEAAEPLSPKNVYGAVYRANTLDGALVRQLVEPDGDVTIVKHDTMLDLDARPLSEIKAPLYPGKSDCYADLVLAKVYGIIPSPRRNPYGPLGQLIAGGGRLVSEFWMMKITGPGAKPTYLKGKFVSPLPASAATVQPGTPDAAAVEAASNENLRQFVDSTRNRNR